jgi:hypothetical protein
VRTFSLALRNLLRNRRRSLITLVAMVIGAVTILLFGGYKPRHHVRSSDELRAPHRSLAAPTQGLFPLRHWEPCRLRHRGLSTRDGRGRAILAASDAIRNPDKPFGLTVTLIEYRNSKQTDSNMLSVYSKADTNSGQYRTLIRFNA